MQWSICLTWPDSRSLLKFSCPIIGHRGEHRHVLPAAEGGLERIFSQGRPYFCCPIHRLHPLTILRILRKVPGFPTQVPCVPDDTGFGQFPPAPRLYPTADCSCTSTVNLICHASRTTLPSTTSSPTLVLPSAMSLNYRGSGSLFFPLYLLGRNFQISAVRSCPNDSLSTSFRSYYVTVADFLHSLQP